MGYCKREMLSEKVDSGDRSRILGDLAQVSRNSRADWDGKAWPRAKLPKHLFDSGNDLHRAEGFADVIISALG